MYRYLIVFTSLLILSGCTTTGSTTPEMEKTSPAQLEKETVAKESCSTPECDEDDEDETEPQPEEDTLGSRSKPWETDYPKKPWEPDFPKKPWEPDFPHRPSEQPID